MVIKITNEQKEREYYDAHLITGLGVEGHYTKKTDLESLINSLKWDSKISIKYYDRYGQTVSINIQNKVFWTKKIIMLYEMAFWNGSREFGKSKKHDDLWCYFIIDVYDRKYLNNGKHIANYLAKLHDVDVEVRLHSTK